LVKGQNIFQEPRKSTSERPRETVKMGSFETAFGAGSARNFHRLHVESVIPVIEGDSMAVEKTCLPKQPNPQPIYACCETSINAELCEAKMQGHICKMQRDISTTNS
jgi:hypothetical protein